MYISVFLAKYAKYAKYSKSFLETGCCRRHLLENFAYFAYFEYFARKRLIACTKRYKKDYSNVYT
jgi:hypothetical protein